MPLPRTLRNSHRVTRKSLVPSSSRIAARRIVCGRRVARSAVGHPHRIDFHQPASAYQHGEAGDVAEAQVADREVIDALRQHAIARRETGERHVVRRQSEARFQFFAIAVHREIVQPDIDCRAPRSARGP